MGVLTLLQSDIDGSETKRSKILLSGNHIVMLVPGGEGPKK